MLINGSWTITYCKQLKSLQNVEYCIQFRVFRSHYAITVWVAYFHLADLHKWLMVSKYYPRTQKHGVAWSYLWCDVRAGIQMRDGRYEIRCGISYESIWFRYSRDICQKKSSNLREFPIFLNVSSHIYLFFIV